MAAIPENRTAQDAQAGGSASGVASTAAGPTPPPTPQPAPGPKPESPCGGIGQQPCK
ncbi:hypothetical protein ACGFX4_31930 [Kitasatospora sp. NPDC048365]|uniref:hypothetical protein n=1 Tax=Kitasatospora sp. NPDC048365 TaxID=3364050 RepID=UPI003720C7C3